MRLRTHLLRAGVLPGSDDCGAVMVETLVALPTTMAFFASILQLSYLSIASLVVQHAAVAAARSASVIVSDDPFAFSDQSAIGSADGDRLATITSAANAVIKALQPLPSLGGTQGSFNPTATVTLLADGDSATEFEVEDVIQAKVSYDFSCGVLFGGSLICGPDGKVTLTTVAAMPNQGAAYAFY